MKTNTIFKILFLITAVVATYALFIVGQRLQNINPTTDESSTWFTFKDLLGLLALLLSPIFAVVIGQKLQDKKSKKDLEYNNKFSIFSTILGFRHSKGYSENFVIALNQIPIVFNKNKSVIKKLKSYIKNHKDMSMDETTALNVLNSELNDLVIAIANDLNFPNVDNYVMTNYFYPKSSELRHNQELLYNEIYLAENYNRLSILREQGNEQNPIYPQQPV
jgi:hypothetical protein